MTSITTTNIQSIEKLERADLLNQETAMALVNTAVEINSQKKELEAQDKSVKDAVKRMFADAIESEQNVAIYNWDTGNKITLTAKGGSVDIDDFALMKAIYAHYGEELDNREGQAWQAFCAVTDPVECPRTINQKKLEDVLGISARAAEAKHAAVAPMVDESMVKAAMVVKKPTYAAGCSAISKAELSAHEAGELVDTIVVKER